MKKKIKDLTLEECAEICKKQDGCKNCPLGGEKGCYRAYLSELRYLKDIDLESEVEL